MMMSMIIVFGVDCDEVQKTHTQKKGGFTSDRDDCMGKDLRGDDKRRGHTALAWGI